MTIPLALQLYTLREAIDQDFTGTVEKVAAMGYAGVETAFFPEDVTAAQASRLFKSLDLTVMGAHCEIPVGDQKNEVLDYVAALDCPRIIWHGWPQDKDYGSIDGIKRLAELYNEANAVAQANGLSFGLHNHWWEFEPVEGRYPYQILLEEIESSIFFEVDTYWVKTAGPDPIAVVKELGQRAPVLHIKDGPASKEAPMVAAGQGLMDIPGLVEAGAGHTKWLVVELDRCATDMFEAVARSYDYLIGAGLAHGKN